ncbi:MAG: tetratricopeptide repeat protein [Candidatus Latescibacteria bacterium]|nr:tetratricopeptide repeat protein [Candidatus Latescibacterota bacterium]
MAQLLIIAAAISIGVVGARFFPTEEMLQDRFALGQKYYAANDHENSVQVFSQIEKTPNYALLDVDHINVSIGELTLPIRVAATYQLGNSYRNVGRTRLERSRSAADEGDQEAAAVRLEEAQQAFGAGKDFYRQLVEDEDGPPFNLRVMAQYQIVRASYQMENYAAVVEEAEELARLFPGSEYEEAALYDAGWARFYMDQHRQAIATFARQLALSTDVLKSDRAFFQTGESHFALGEYDLARSWYGKLVDKYDFARISEKQLQQMKAQRLRGLVQETTRELVAKAQIRIGDAFAQQQRVDEAIAAYSQVPARYPQESLLVQKSFDNMATMVLEQQDADAGVAVLRQAIEQVEDPYFRGRVQLKIARTFFARQRYGEAIDEYQIYLKAYGEWADAIGVSPDQIEFWLAEAHRELARDQDAATHLQEARSYYRGIIDQYPSSPRVPEAYYGLGQVHFSLGQYGPAAAEFGRAVEQFPQAPVAPYALNWQARASFSQGKHEEAAQLYGRLIEQYPDGDLLSQAWKDRGLVYKQMGQIDRALDAFGRVAPSSPEWTKIQAEAGDMLLAAGRANEIATRFDLDQAVQVAAAQGDGETLAELCYIQGRMARERRDHGAEIDYLSAALEHSDNPQLDAFILFFRGLAYYHQGSAADAAGQRAAGTAHFQASVADLERLLESDEGSQLRPVAYRTRGVALTRLGRSGEAVNTYQILIGAAATAGERAEFELMLMELYYDQGQLPETEKVARSLLATAHQGSGAATQERAYFVLVSLLLEQQRYEETLSTVRQARQRFPQSDNRATLMSVEARSLFFLERYEEARTAFQRFTATYPDHPDAVSAYYQLGYCNEILGQYKQAAQAFLQLADRYPDDPLVADALYRCGENLYNDSAFEEALDIYMRLVSQQAQTEFAAKGLYSASWTYMDLDRAEDSIAAMGRLVAEFPHSEYARYAQFSIGDYYYSKKAYQQAQQAYQQVVARYPETGEADKAGQLIADLDEDLASLAYDEIFVEFDRGNYAAAAAGFEQIFRDYPKSYSALAALANKGVALEHLGDSQQARGTYQKVIEIASGSPDSETIVEFVKLRLENL